MKVHYINIFLFALPLNILVNTHKEPFITHHTPKIPTTRLLCECDLYIPNYDNDPQMKKIMENFDRQTSQRFHEYDDRMKTTRQKCKDKCDKEIQKIILKDKLEKELNEKFLTLQTDIQNDAFPTCVCEKSIADKVEKGCLRCGSILGAAMPELGAMGAMALYTLNQWSITATADAIAAATKAGMDAATKAGLKAVILKIEEINKVFSGDPGFFNLKSIVSKLTYNNGDALLQSAKELIGESCRIEGRRTGFYNTVIQFDSDYNIKNFAKAGSAAYDAVLPTKTAAFKAKNIAAVEATTTSWETVITASIIAIVVIVLILVIIYLILRYRRKKKMKKKLQYIKLLEE
ncbi:hypothetical protein PFAG_04232 [Plasmodium falciparum Santa Lucia]|uniref:Rifin n=2 Tax=Plasmodium falciparum TaxID=5833 RepID=A0A0L7KLP5_PLAFX|nr:hypothetical protein PFAG_04232 [Plasmodium falciparum Santa Lucia]KOB63819.1 hypothetical protein PFHG_04726 [Plasmodium falciparum HB3]